MSVLPLFTSAYSFRSILTLDKPEKLAEGEVRDESGADSIIQICKDEGIKNLYLVEDNMVGFLEAKKNAGKDINLRFGLRLTFCNDITQKTDESHKSECKFVIFALGPNGYRRLAEIFTAANVEGFFGKPRMDFKTLAKYWNDTDLLLVVPFYDSFLFMNGFFMANCVPDFGFTKPTFFIENNGLYFDGLIEQQINDFDKENLFPRVRTKSIYYKKRKDFLAWMTYKCIKNESTLREPELPNCMSDAFCVEAWKEANNDVSKSI